MAHWGIVGGGLLGMTLAHRLAHAGRRVTLIEGRPDLGGLAGAWKLEDVVWDRYYHVILASDSRLRALLTELDLECEMEWAQTKTGFYTNGQYYSMSNAIEFLRFPPLNLLQKFRLGLTIFRASRIKDWEALERMTVAGWLTRWSGRSTFEKIWLPLLRAKLGEAYRRTSAAFIWATIARMYAARRSGLKTESFGHVRGGYARILDRFAEVLNEEKVETALSWPVGRVEGMSDGKVLVTSVDDRQQLFDNVVLTLPAPVASAVCPQLTDREKAKHAAIEYVGIVCASLLLKRPLAGYYITNITESWVPFTAVIEMTALVDRGELGGHSLVYLPKYVAPDDPIFARSDQEIEEEFVPALLKMHPAIGRDDVLSFQVSRARHVFALSTIDYSKNLPSVSTSIPGVHILNTAHIVNGTLNVNETVQLAERTLPRLIEAE